jgi:Zn/Cd-binding protein ZinT
MAKRGAAMKKEETPIRKARRKYEENNKEARDAATKQFNTRLSRRMHDEICAFLKEHHITKVELIYAGFEALQAQHGPKKE